MGQEVQMGGEQGSFVQKVSETLFFALKERIFLYFQRHFCFGILVKIIIIFLSHHRLPWVKYVTKNCDMAKHAPTQITDHGVSGVSGVSNILIKSSYHFQKQVFDH